MEAEFHFMDLSLCYPEVFTFFCHEIHYKCLFLAFNNFNHIIKHALILSELSNSTPNTAVKLHCQVSTSLDRTEARNVN